ncbi:hypothetical protein [Nannocystis pusilla]|uniref:hypothetical protein n=1 Tax=Nannocystis pusilla TaxID=889268 RepID=UPI003B82705F
MQALPGPFSRPSSQASPSSTTPLPHSATGPPVVVVVSVSPSVVVVESVVTRVVVSGPVVVVVVSVVSVEVVVDVGLVVVGVVVVGSEVVGTPVVGSGPVVGPVVVCCDVVLSVVVSVFAVSVVVAVESEHAVTYAQVAKPKINLKPFMFSKPPARRRYHGRSSSSNARARSQARDDLPGAKGR